MDIVDHRQCGRGRGKRKRQACGDELMWNGGTRRRHALDDSM